MRPAAAPDSSMKPPYSPVPSLSVVGLGALLELRLRAE